MDRIKDAILEQLEASTTSAYVDLMVAAQTVGSEQLYCQALNGLISTRESLNLTQAKLIGVEATFDVLTTLKRCGYCNHVAWKCDNCNRG